MGFHILNNSGNNMSLVEFLTQGFALNSLFVHKNCSQFFLEYMDQSDKCRKLFAQLYEHLEYQDRVETALLPKLHGCTKDRLQSGNQDIEDARVSGVYDLEKKSDVLSQKALQIKNLIFTILDECVTSGGVHLRGLAPANSALKKSSGGADIASFSRLSIFLGGVVSAFFSAGPIFSA